VLEINVVTRAEPFHWTEEEATKLVPVKVSVKPLLPNVVEVGEMEVSVGTGLLIVSICAFEVPPPGAAFTTVIDAVPAIAISTTGMVTLIEELEMKVVTSGVPLKSIVDDALKFVPVTVSVKAGPPAVVDVGEIELVVGTGLLIVNVCELEVPPPGAGFATVMGTVPAVATSAAVITAVRVVLEIKVVARAEPLKSTVDDALKFVPVTVSVNWAPPAVVDVGEIEVVVGIGFLTVSVCAPAVPPPGAGFTTVIESVPPTVMFPAGTVILMVVLEMKVVVNGTPLKSIVEEALKFVPVTVNVKDGPPAVVDVGEIELVVGTGLLIVNVCAFDVPPPGVGFTTVIEAIPPTAISAAVMVAVSVVLETKVVARAEPLKSTVDDALKFVPVTVSVKLFPPAVVGFGETEVVVGTGLLTVRVCVPEVPPPGAGFTTVIESVPPTVMFPAGTVILIVVLEMKVVVNGTPLKSTVDDALKFVPVTVSVKLFPPAVVEVGLIKLAVGTGLLIVSVCAFDVPPPGVGFTTVIEAVPPTAISAADTIAVTCV
jgi:branched-subunit amino acid transport protein